MGVEPPGQSKSRAPETSALSQLSPSIARPSKQSLPKTSKNLQIFIKSLIQGNYFTFFGLATYTGSRLMSRDLGIANQHALQCDQTATGGLVLLGQLGSQCVNVRHVQHHLAALLEAVERGERIRITD